MYRERACVRAALRRILNRQYVIPNRAAVAALGLALIIRGIRGLTRGQGSGTRDQRSPKILTPDAWPLTPGRARDQLEIILRGVADGITAQDAAGRVIYAND